MGKVDIFFSLNVMDNVDVSVGRLYSIGEHCVNRCVFAVRHCVNLSHC